MKVAIVHEWLVNFAGSEKVLSEILKLFPQADLYCLIDFLPEDDRNHILNKKANTSFIQKLPFARKKYQLYLPLMPLAIEQLDLSQYHLIISSSHAVAKGVITGPDQLHISYVHSPMRYAWDLQHQYLRESNVKGIRGGIARWLLHRMRIWDVRTSNGVDHFIANSKFIARRIWKIYRREAKVIHPPVAVEDFQYHEQKDDYYITVSRMVPYKKIDLIVEAFSSMPDKKLVVIGEGPEYQKIKSKAGENVEFLGFLPDHEVKSYMQRAKAFVFAAEEDFGIAPVEAQACGTPVIAFGKGGVLETVEGFGLSEKPSGIFYDEQSVASLVDAVNKFEEVKDNILPLNCRESAVRFSTVRFIQEFAQFVQQKTQHLE